MTRGGSSGLLKYEVLIFTPRPLVVVPAALSSKTHPGQCFSSADKRSAKTGHRGGIAKPTCVAVGGAITEYK